MRDSNYKSVSANRAAVTISTTLYDRRALDCTSDRPLVNSLNHLTFLASSSAKVRETLSNDGGIERLVDILHECVNPKDDAAAPLVAWKWTLAFQCLVLVGTRGTEEIRAKVAKADMIPVIATVFDNFLYQHEKEMKEPDSSIFREDEGLGILYSQIQELASRTNERTDATLESVSSSFPDGGDSGSAKILDILSQAKSEPSQIRINNIKLMRRAFLAQLLSKLNSSNDYNATARDTFSQFSPISIDPVIVDYLERCQPISSVVDMGKLKRNKESPRVHPPRDFLGGVLVPREEDIIWSLQLLAFISKYSTLKPHLSHTHIVAGLSLRRGSDVPALENDDMDVEMDEVDVEEIDHLESSGAVIDKISDLRGERNTSEKVFEMIRLEQFLSKQIQLEMDKLKEKVALNRHSRKDRLKNRWNYVDYEDFDSHSDMDHSLIPLQYVNIFPLVERFTVKPKNSKDVSYWAGVIMRNSCRRDESRGGVRQCACFDCGRWEDFPRQFAKCRRCKRTKYCSKECQSKAWEYHKHWCLATGASSSREAGPADETDEVRQGQPRPMFRLQGMNEDNVEGT